MNIIISKLPENHVEFMNLESVVSLNKQYAISKTRYSGENIWMEKKNIAAEFAVGK